MKKVEILDLNYSEEIEKNSYEWLILAIGVESRTRFVIEKLLESGVNINNVLILSYQDFTNQSAIDQSVASVKALFADKGIPVLDEKLETDSKKSVWQLLNTHLVDMEDKHILVDYSAMSRAWYASILYWFKQKTLKEHQTFLYFLYAIGKYSRDVAEKEVVIKKIEVVPGCEGGNYRHDKTIAIFGLGFYGYMSLCACEQIEPDEIYTLSTKEDPVDGFSIKDCMGNKELIESANKNFRIPVSSVVQAYNCLSEIANTHIAKGDEVILVPMGPKPQVLASILVSFSNPSVCTLRVRHEDYSSEIEASGRIILTRIRFIQIEESVAEAI